MEASGTGSGSMDRCFRFLFHATIFERKKPTIFFEGGGKQEKLEEIRKNCEKILPRTIG